VAHAVDNDRQLVGDELAPQTQQAFRMRPRRPSRLEEILSIVCGGPETPLMIAAAA
jgi:hypothetical protein